MIKQEIDLSEKFKKWKMNGKNKSEIKKKLGNKCVYCGCENKLFLTIDHIIPLSRKGLNEEKNMQVTCVLCNNLKTNHTDKEFKDILKAYNLLKKNGMLKFNFIGNNIDGFRILPILNHNHYSDFKRDKLY